MLKKLIQLTIIASAAWTFNAQAALDMFLRLEPFTSENYGEAEHAEHKDEIDVLAWSWGLSNSGTTHEGGGGGAGKVSVQDISFTKYIDKSSTQFYKHAANGAHFVSAKLTVRRAGGEQVEYVIITMTDVLVTSASTGGSGGEDRLTENITLNFAKYCVEYTPLNAAGFGDIPKVTCWDIAGNVEAAP